MLDLFARHLTGSKATLLGLASAAAIAASGLTGQPAGAQTEQGPIVNTAKIEYVMNGVQQEPVVTGSAVIEFRPPDTASELELMRYAPNVDGSSMLMVNGSDRSPSGTLGTEYMQQSPATDTGGTAIPVPANLPLLSVDSLISGEPLYTVVKDLGANLDATGIDTVVILKTVSHTGDQESLRLYETAPDTGVFVGFAQTVNGHAFAQGDGILNVIPGSVITSTYQDARNPDDVSTDRAVVDPYGRVFDSRSGDMVNGAEITLVDAATGRPAKVFGIDRTSIFPSTVTSGAAVTDSSGRIYNFGRGEFRFPIVEGGSYALRVSPPGTYAAPSEASDAALQALPNAPFALNDGSRGRTFELGANLPVSIDIPLDLGSNLRLTKTASTALAGIGDFLRYDLTLSNFAESETGVLTVTDTMPRGFRYQQGSLRVEDIRVDPAVSEDGRELTFETPAIAVSRSVEIRYVVEVTVGARTGTAVNAAIAEGSGGFLSNLAEAEVEVADDFMRDRNVIVGRVSAEACDLSEDWPREIFEGESVPGVRVYMEDGTHAVSDRDGQFHFEGVTPGTHVVQLDTTTLPQGYEPVLCEENSRIGNRPTSRMVDLRGGALWRADFYLRRTGPVAPPAESAPSPASSREEESSAFQVTQYGPDWLATQTAELAWVYPENPESLPFPGLKVGIKHAVGQTIALTVNGEAVPANKIAAQARSADGTVAITHWRGIDLRDGANSVVAVATGEDGRETGRLARDVHYVTEIRKAVFMPDLSVLDADGQTTPEIAIRFTDGAGRPVHRGAVIDVQVQPPYRSASSEERFENDPLTETDAARADTVVGDDGVARVRLEPTLRSGSVRLLVKLGEGPRGRLEKTIDAWLKPGQREWILVGLAEGSAALNTVRGNMESSDVEDGIDVDGRVAFFAKGTIKGEWLLTLAYDSERRRDERDDVVFRQINPDAYYTLYGDSSIQDYEAESRYPLYVRVERENFYAMAGDYDSEMNRTELARFDRRLSGVKVAYRDETYDVIAFGADTNQAFVREELLSLGTTGPYRLSNAPIVRNSEAVVVETRDRFRNDVVLSTQVLVRWLDYSIDYPTGVVTLKKPIPVTDRGFNPNVLSFEYESVNAVERALTYGGRSAVKLFGDRVEVGASYVHEGTTLDGSDGESDLGGVDVRVSITENTELKAEYARSHTAGLDHDASGDAYLVDLVHQDEKLQAHAYFRREDHAFGVDQLSLATGATQIYGGEVDYLLREGGEEGFLPGRTSLSLAAFREEALDTGATRTVAEGGIEHEGENYDLAAGLRFLDYHFASDQEDSSVLQVTSAASYDFDALPLTVYSQNEQAVMGSSEAEFDTRHLVGADYRFTDWLTGTAAYEYGEGEGFQVQNLRAGLSATPWTGGTINASATDQRGFDEEGDRLAASFGVGQTVQITERLSATAGFEHQEMISGEKFDAPRSPFTRALLAEDFTVANVGLGWLGDDWSASTRAEVRVDQEETRYGVSAGVVGDITENLSVAAWFDAAEWEPETGDDRFRSADVRLAAAYRPLDQGPIILNRLDVEMTDQGETLNPDLDGSWLKVIDNLSANFRVTERAETSLHVGVKYAEQELDGETYGGLSSFVGAEGRYDLTRKLDVGVHGGVAYSANSSVTDYAFGLSIGYSLFDNTWVSLGYNFAGLSDDDFGGADFTSDGFFLKLRVNFDQDTVRSALNQLRMN